jgi:hypothetical protein
MTCFLKILLPSKFTFSSVLFPEGFLLKRMISFVNSKTAFILQIICGEEQLLCNSQHKAFNTAVWYATHMGDDVFQFGQVSCGIFLFL